MIITQIPTAELKADLEETERDIVYCYIALTNLGIRAGHDTYSRYEGNLEIRQIIQAELARREGK